jgi:hypothetical protein
MATYLVTTIVEKRETLIRNNIYKCGGKSSDLSVIEVDDLVKGVRGHIHVYMACIVQS